MIVAGADIIMLPMFRTVDEIKLVSDAISGRCAFVPLVETVDALKISATIAAFEGVNEIYFGLNDLHRDAGLSFIFEP